MYIHKNIAVNTDSCQHITKYHQLHEPSVRMDIVMYECTQVQISKHKA